MKLLIEASPLEQPNPTGVNYFTEWLCEALEGVSDDSFLIDYFYLNFLHRKPLRNQLTIVSRATGRLQQLGFIPQKVYARLLYYSIAPPLPLRKSDWVLYPNFYIWPSMRKTKKAVIIHDVSYLVHPEYADEKNVKFLKRVVTQSIKAADLVIANSNFTREELIKHAHVPREKIITISIPVDHKQFEQSLNKGTQLLASKFSIKKPYILSLGTLEPRKNLETLINAYCLLPQNIRKSHSLVLAGKWGWKTESLRSLIEKKQHEGFDIITTDHISNEERATLYHNASVYGISSYYEGFGMPLLEALYCGIPSVAVDIPVLREVGQDGCIWSSRNPSEMAQGIASIITDKKLADSLSKKGRERAAQFSWQSVARAIKQRLKDEYES